jgi:hypothetical protein
VTRSVHCECTLLMHLVKGTLAKEENAGMHVHIGVLKSVCLLCGVFMDMIMRKYPQIHITVSSHHGKNVAGWRVPPSTPPNILVGIYDHINSTFAEIRYKAIRERRSESETRGLADDFMEDNVRLVKATCVLKTIASEPTGSAHRELPNGAWEMPPEPVVPLQPPGFHFSTRMTCRESTAHPELLVHWTLRKPVVVILLPIVLWNVTPRYAFTDLHTDRGLDTVAFQIGG